MRRSGLRRLATSYRHLGLRESDVFVASYPKSGNTWVKFVLADLLLGRDVDFVEADRVVPVVGRHRPCRVLLPTGGRLIKTHEPARTEYRRAIYVIRDVRDVAVSYGRWLAGFGIRFEDRDRLVAAFVAGQLGGYGTWADHVEGWMQAQEEGRAMVLRYEDLKHDPAPHLLRAARFAQIDVDHDAVARALERNSPEQMRRKEAGNDAYFRDLGWKNWDISFVGNATVGEGAQHLTGAQLRMLAPWVALHRDVVRTLTTR